jgi:hypothetical protein
VADALRKPVAVLTEHTPTPRPLQVASNDRLDSGKLVSELFEIRAIGDLPRS